MSEPMSDHMDPLSLQKVFRVVLDAVSQPGKPQALPDGVIGSPAQNLLCVLETFLDHEVTFAVIERDIYLERTIIQRTQSRLAPIEEADYIIVEGSTSGGRILRAKRGTPEFPEKGATIIYSAINVTAPSLSLERISLSGPGIMGGEMNLPSFPGIDVGELSCIREANEDFPLGLDCFFIDGRGAMMGLPRSVRINGV